MRLRAILLVLVVGLASTVVWVTTRTGKPMGISLPAVFAPRPSMVRPATSWPQWQRSREAATVDARLKRLLSSAHDGQGGEPFEIVRGFSKRPRETHFACTHFEKQHALGRAVDVHVTDLNDDGRIDLDDAGRFARELENSNGTVAVIGWQKGNQQELWLHIDVGSVAERWGEWRVATVGMGYSIEPVFWTKAGRSARERRRAWKLPANDWRLVVEKKPVAHVFDAGASQWRRQSVLHLYAGRQRVRSYPVALGYDAVGDKQKRDDYRTPEGDFYLCGANDRSQFHKSLRLSYPNAEDGERGVRQGLIDEATNRKIARAVRRKRMPPHNTRLGGDIMLHGGGGIRENWTWGCIALDNDQMDELFDLLPYGAPIKVLGVKQPSPA